MPDFVSFLLFAFTLAIKRRNFVFENHGSTLTVLNKNDMMSDLNIYWGKMYDCVSVPFFVFTLVIKPRNFDFESHWNILIFSDKKKLTLEMMTYHLETLLSYTEDHQINYWNKQKAKDG